MNNLKVLAVMDLLHDAGLDKMGWNFWKPKVNVPAVTWRKKAGNFLLLLRKGVSVFGIILESSSKGEN